MIGLPKPGGDELAWIEWPADESLPPTAFSADGLAITGFAKLRPCLVITRGEEIADHGLAQVLPISTFKTTTPMYDGLLKGNHIAHLHFLPGDGRSVKDGYVDFRWTWRLKARDLAHGTHEASLDDETMVRLLLRFRDYLYPAPD